MAYRYFMVDSDLDIYYVFKPDDTRGYLYRVVRDGRIEYQLITSTIDGKTDLPLDDELTPEQFAHIYHDCYDRSLAYVMSIDLAYIPVEGEAR